MLLHKLTIYDKEDELIEKTLLNLKYARFNNPLFNYSSGLVEEKLSYSRCYGGATLSINGLNSETLAKKHFDMFLKSRSKVEDKKNWDIAANAIMIIEEALSAGEENLLLTSSSAYVRTMAQLILSKS